MNDNQTSDDVKYANWTDDMKEIHKELTKDYKDGKFTFSDLNFQKIGDLGKKLVHDIENEVSDKFKQIKNKIFKNTSADLQQFENNVKGLGKGVEKELEHWGA